MHFLLLQSEEALKTFIIGIEPLSVHTYSDQRLVHSSDVLTLGKMYVGCGCQMLRLFCVQIDKVLYTTHILATVDIIYMNCRPEGPPLSRKWLTKMQNQMATYFQI